MKPITSYKELLESFIKQIKESEVTDERIIDLHMYIDNSLELAKYRDSKPMSFDDSYLTEEYERFKNSLV